MVAQRFVRRGMKWDCTNWVQVCIPCQKAKIGRHTRSSLSELEQAGLLMVIYSTSVDDTCTVNGYKTQNIESIRFCA